MGNKESIKIDKIVRPTDKDFVQYYDIIFFEYYNRKDIFEYNGKIPIPYEWFIEWFKKNRTINNKTAKIKCVSKILLILIDDDDIKIFIDDIIIENPENVTRDFFNDSLQIPIDDRLIEITKNIIIDLCEKQPLLISDTNVVDNINNTNSFDAFISNIATTFSTVVAEQLIKSDKDIRNKELGNEILDSIDNRNHEILGLEKTKTEKLQIIIKSLDSWKDNTFKIKRLYNFTEDLQTVNIAIYPYYIKGDTGSYNRLFLHIPKETILNDIVPKHFSAFTSEYSDYIISYEECIDIGFVGNLTAFIYKIQICNKPDKF